MRIQATQMVPGSTGLALSTFTASMFLGQSVGVSLAALGASRLGSDWVFGFTAAGCLILGVGMTALMRRRLQR